LYRVEDLRAPLAPEYSTDRSQEQENRYSVLRILRGGFKNLPRYDISDIGARAAPGFNARQDVEKKIRSGRKQQAGPPRQRSSDINQVFTNIAFSSAHASPFSLELKEMEQRYQILQWCPAYQVTNRMC
jgi:hypothetical protein